MLRFRYLCMAKLRDGDRDVSEDSTIHLTDDLVDQSTDRFVDQSTDRVRPLEPGEVDAELRICEDPECSTVLSRYNDQDGCSLHARMVVPRMRGKVL